uniref:Uncharacterized protein n=1 Tax=Panagrolaimus sp. PS1159 TaxID=55785 RepID=A0AC35G2D9_9BILA
MLQPYKNQTAKTIIWEFVSDGSITGFGFEIDFAIIQCVCETVIPCNSTIHLIKGERVYCSNLQCDLVVLPCPSEFVRLDIFIDVSYNNVGFSTQDLFQVYSNDTLVYEFYFSNVKQTNNFVLLNSTYENIVKATTFISSVPRGVYFKTSNFNKPNVSTNVILSPKNPSYIIDVKLYPMISVKISEEMVIYSFKF